MTNKETIPDQAPVDKEKLVIDPKAPLQGQMDAFFKKRSQAELKKKIVQLSKTSKDGK